MKCLILAFATALVLAAPARAAGPDPREQAAVLAVLDRFFAAMTAHDAKTWAEIRLPDSMSYTQRMAPDGSVKLRSGTARDDIANLPAGPAMSERVWSPTVMIRGPIAVVWAPYEFKLDGKRHHCGIDVFDFVKVDGAWKMANSMWTSEPAACDELGADKK